MSITFRQLLQQRNWTQAALAHQIGVSPGMLANWSQARDLPSDAQVWKIAEAVGVDKGTVIDAFVETMKRLNRYPPAIDWYPEVWYGPCWEHMSERAERRATFVASVEAEFAPKRRSGLDILIDRACGLEKEQPE